MSLLPPSVRRAFPGAALCNYLNTANVCLMHDGAERTALEWQRDVAWHGSNNFTEEVEERVFAPLHDAGAALFGCAPRDIAVGSSATELLASLAWAVMPPAGSNIVGTACSFPSTVYPWARVAQHTGAEVRLAQPTDVATGVTGVGGANGFDGAAGGGDASLHGHEAAHSLQPLEERNHEQDA